MAVHPQQIPVRATAEAIASAPDAEAGLQALVDAFGRHLDASVALLAYTWYDPDERVGVRALWTRDRASGRRALPEGIDEELLSRALRSGDGVFTAGMDEPEHYMVAKVHAAHLRGILFAALDEAPDPEGAATEAARDFAALAAVCLRDAARLETLRKLATHDELTGCLNRAGILAVLESELARCARHQSAAALCFLDLEGFKRVDDEHGHLVGDQVLSEIARRLREEVRPYDSVGRYGGDEFLVVMPEADRESATAVADRLIAAITNLDLADVALGAHYGIAEWQPGRDVDELLRLSDRALLAAKRARTNV